MPGRLVIETAYATRTSLAFTGTALLLAFSSLATLVHLPIQRPLGWLCAKMLATAGGAFVKVGQLLATRRDLFDSEFARQLERLHEQASRADFNACIRDLPQPVSARLVGEYRVDNARPLGSGAVAQVFAAVRHADGAPVAIKVIRKRSRGLVLRDAAAMRSLARRMSQLRVVSSVPLFEAVRECLLPICLQFNLGTRSTKSTIL